VILFPAIDIRGGGAVRLLRGDYEAETAYDPDPADAARRWHEGGAEILHVVDLDGAKAGEPVNLEAIERIAAAVPIPIQVGGGIRDLAAVKRLHEAGASRLVIGTAALRDPEFLAAAIELDPQRVVVGVDARGGKVSVSGWTETSDLDAADAVVDLAERGARHFLFTPIEVDGTLEGPNLPELARVAAACAEVGASVIASGGVGTLDHLRELRAAATSAVEGVIVGRALYERRFTVAEALAALA
jgi:phosphoribosylformimino-5-aminoimidazole carboxamide ribotide isomerase